MTIRRLAGALSLSASVPALATGGTVIGQVPAGAGASVTRNGSALAASAFSVSSSGLVSLVGSQLTRGDVVTVSAVRTGSAATGSVPAPAITGFVAEGDSLTYGYLSSNAATKSYPAVLSALTGLPFTNQGQTSDTLANMDANYAANDAPLYNATNSNLFILLAGINDIGANNATLSQLQTNFQSITGKAKATGYIVAVLTVLTSNYSGTTDAQRSVRQQYNAWMAANWTSYADVFIDAASDPRLSDTTNTTYFNADQLHLTDTGYAALADVVRTGLKVPYANPATAYTLTGSSAPVVGTASTYTLAANGPLSNAVTVSIAASPDGTLSASSVTLPAGSSPSATFTYTAASTGSKTLTATNNGGLTNPAALTLTAAAAPTGPVFNTTPNKGAATYSNNNRTITVPSNAIVLTATAASGKKLLAVSWDTVGSSGGYDTIGFANATTADGPGFGTSAGEAGPGYYNNGSTWYLGSQLGSSAPSFVTGAKTGAVIDTAASLVWFTADGTNFYGSSGPLTAAQVAAGTGGINIVKTTGNGAVYGVVNPGLANSVATLISWPSGWNVPSGFSSM